MNLKVYGKCRKMKQTYVPNRLSELTNNAKHVYVTNEYTCYKIK